MDHRYGRHGPHAWKKRRKRLFERKALVPFVHTGVIVVYVPAIYLERITIVIAVDQFPPDEDPKAPVPFPQKELLPGIPSNIKESIQRQAKTYADDQVKDDKDVANSIERVKAIAVKLAKPQVDNIIRRRGNSALEVQRSALEEFYADSYVDFYTEKWTDDYGREFFPEEELATKEDALQDKQLYGDTVLLNLTYLATLRTSRRTKVHEDNIVAYLADIAKLSNLYEKTYRTQQDRTQQGGDQSGPAPFRS